MLPNVNQITSRLAMMSDQQLQQYAALHKADPYVFPMAFAESNRRKDMRMAQQGQMGQQQQPRVVDQAIAGMSQGLPENSGIGMLPAPNMQSMAGGGITGFSGEEGSFVSDGRATTAFGRFFGPELREGVSDEERAAAQKKRGDQAQLDAFNNSKQLRINALRSNIFTPTTQAQRDQTAREIMAIEAELPPGVSNAYPDTNAQRFPAPGIAPPGAAPGNTISQSTGRGGPAVGEVARYQATQNNQTGTSSPGIGRPGTAVAADGDYMTQLDAIRAKQRPAVDKLSTQRQKLVDTANTNAETTLKELKDEQNARGVAGKGQEERLAKREAGITADRQTNKAFSFINAGLTMMQSRGQGLAGIAEGAMVGTKQYGEGIAKIKLAQEKADEARDKLDELRRNESTMNAKEVRAAKADIRSTALQGQKDMFTGVMDALRLDRNDANAAVAGNMGVQGQQRTIDAAAEIARRGEAGATARAAMPSGEMRVAMMLGTGKTDAARLESGLAKHKELMGDKQGMQMLKLFIEENSRREKIGEAPMSIAAFKKQSAGFFAAPAAINTQNARP